MSNLSAKERDALPATKFCGPNRTYPILDQEDIDKAARLIGHADNPERVKRCIIAKARNNGWTIPDAWK